MIEVRALTTVAEFDRLLRLQTDIWGYSDDQLFPVRLFVVALKIGGQVFGAFDGARMVGFCVALPGIRPGVPPFLHSHMLGVLPKYRDGGVGGMLKWKQREEALSRAIDLVEWTFDPLEIKNAYFNIERLGAVVRHYVLNQYGVTSSRLHGGLPTDRCVAEWWLASDRVRAALDGHARERPPVEARIEVPLAIETLRREDLPKAREIQKRVSGQFQEYLGRGLAATGLEKHRETAVYLLSKWE
jgi:predicted GNAT superfamily acetyltransferase